MTKYELGQFPHYHDSNNPAIYIRNLDRTLLWNELQDMDGSSKRELLETAVEEFGLGTVQTDLMNKLDKLRPSDMIWTLQMTIEREKTLSRYLEFGVSRALSDELMNLISSGVKLNESNNYELYRFIQSLKKSIEACLNAGDLYAVFEGKKFIDGIVSRYLGGMLDAHKDDKKWVLSRLKKSQEVVV